MANKPGIITGEDEDEGRSPAPAMNNREVDDDDHDETESSLKTQDLKDAEADARADQEDEDSGLSEDEIERRREARREQRKQQKLRKKEFERRDREKIAMLESRLQELQQQVGNTNQHMTVQQQAMLQKDVSDIESYIARARTLKREAQQNGDWDAVDKLDEALFEGRRQLDAKKNILARISNPQMERPAVDPRLVQHAQNWMGRHSWFNKPGNEEDTAIIKAIDQGLVQSGWDPSSEAFWQELNRRAKRRMPDRFNASARNNEDFDDDDDEDAPSPRRPARPPQGGSSRSGGANGASNERLPKEFVENLKEAGIWDDKKRRDRAIKDHLRIKNTTAA